jgi:acetyltransferase-like isoleucine patch superfamily enzyme
MIMFKLLREINYIKSKVRPYFSPFDNKSELRIGKYCKFLGHDQISFRGSAHFGDFCWVQAISRYRNKTFKSEILIGKNFHANNNLHIGCTGKIVIGDNVLVGSNVSILDHGHGLYGTLNSSSPEIPPIQRELSDGCIFIEDNVWIGEGAKILGSLSIGSGSIIAANAVVTKDVPKNTIVAGIPSKVIKIWCSEKQGWQKVTNKHD